MKHTFLHFSYFRSYSFQSFFSCVLISLSSTFYISPVFLCISSTFSFCLSLSVFYFLSCCLLSFSSDFLCLSSNFSFCFYLFLCLLLSFLAFFYFHSLHVFYDIPLTLLFILLRICVCFLLLLLLLLLSSSLSSCSSFLYFLPFTFFVCLFCLFFHFFFLFYFPYFALFSTLFNYFVLILDFNYCKFSLLFISSINLCYHFPFSFTVFFTKCELFSFFTFQHMLCSVF